MGTGLKSRKKNSNYDGGFDPEAQKGGDIYDMKKHGRVGSLRRFVQSEVGCAIEIIIGFLIFAFLLVYFITHHRHRKVRLSSLFLFHFVGVYLSLINELTIFALFPFRLSGCLSYNA